jgi:SulP family sulfate permease
MGASPDRTKTAAPRSLEAILPIVGWVRSYRREDLRFDLVGGVSLAAFAVPESLAHANLAGLRPDIGLYSSMAAAFAYAVFGRSRPLVVGTDAALALLTGSTVAVLAAGDRDRAAAMAAFAALVAGLIAIVARLLRLGFLSNLVSKSALTGFAFGAGMIIAVHQLPGLFGVEGSHGNFFSQAATFLGRLPALDPVTLVIGAITLALLLAGKRFLPHRPVALLILALAVVAARLLDLPQHGVKTVGAALSTAPSLSWPTEALAHWRQLLPLGLTLFLLSFLDSSAAARELAARRHEAVDSDQELLANGACNIVSGLCRGLPVGGSISRSLGNQETARTQLAGVISGSLILLVALFITTPFAYLPEAVLAATLLLHAFRLMNVAALRHIYALSRREFTIAGVTLLGVLCFGLLWGALMGVALAVLDVLERVSHPYTTLLGRPAGSDRYQNMEENPECQPPEGTLIMRMDASIFFANAESLRGEILRTMASHRGPVRLLVLDLETCPMIDISGAEMLDELRASLGDQGVTLKIAGAHRSVRDFLREENPEKFGQLAPDVAQAVTQWQGKRPEPA